MHANLAGKQTVRRGSQVPIVLKSRAYDGNPQQQNFLVVLVCSVAFLHSICPGASNTVMISNA